MGMRYPITFLCFDVRDESELKKLLSQDTDYMPRLCYWSGRKPPRIEDPVGMMVVRNHLTLFREIPVVCELYPKTNFLVLVDKLWEKVVALPDGNNLWYVDRSVDSRKLCQALGSLHVGRTGSARDSIRLTPREKEVFQLVVAGFSTNEICSSLSMKRSTVNTHKKQLFMKFNVRSSAQMVAASTRALFHVIR